MTKESWLWLAGGLGYGAVNTKELLTACPTGPKGVLKELGGIALDEVLTQKQAEKLASTDPADYALMLSHAEAQGIHVLPINDTNYPRQLYNITNPPLVLFAKGDITLLNDQLSVGMVGARKPSGYGVEAMRNIGRGVALGGAIIVSGLAAGLDSEAHKAALAVNGPTIACIAFGHNSCYPSQNRKLMELVEQYGVVVSEYPPNQKPEKAFFLHRNRLIAGLSHALVVAEARKHSGTMSTVNFATEYGRDVFAVPGSVFSELSGGTNAMIREGAYLAACAADIMSLYGIELPEEDLSKLAAKQAKEGKPVAAPLTNTTRVASSAVGEQTLLEAIQGRLSQDAQTGEERVSRGAAIDAFRRLQQDIPVNAVGDGSERNRALEEMVAAVSDDVVIQKRPNTERSAQRLAWEKQLEEPKGRQTDKVKPFNWDGVERLSREDLQKSDEALEKQARHSRVPQPPYYRPAMAQTQAASPMTMPSVIRPQVPASPQPISPQRPVPTSPQLSVPISPQPQANNGAPFAQSQEQTGQRPYVVKEVVVGAPAQMVQNEKPAKTQAATQKERVVKQSGGILAGARMQNSESTALSGRLRTMQKPADERVHTQSIKQDGFMKKPESAPLAQEAAKPRHTAAEQVMGLQNEPDMPRSEEDLLQTVSKAARAAFSKLSINPRGLAQIAEESGLSSGEAMAALTELELAGLSRQLPGRQFTIVH